MLLYADVEKTLRGMLAGPLPGHEAQLLMAPRPRPGWHPGEVPDGYRTGAGLLLVYARPPEAHLVLTVRADLPHHAGQVSFPGGAVEPEETVEAAALREAGEEVGIEPEAVEVLGRLTPLSIPASGFVLHPVVGLAAETPALHPDPREVDRILQPALGTLGDPDILGRFPRAFRGIEMDVPCFGIDGESVWGATAMVLAEFLVLLGVVVDPWA